MDVVDAFPQDVCYVLECLREVYRTDDAARRSKLSDEQRTRLHQRRSQPVMNSSHRWLIKQLEQRHLEPNGRCVAASVVSGRWSVTGASLRQCLLAPGSYFSALTPDP